MSKELEQDVLRGLVNLVGSHRELYGVYGAVGNEVARAEAEIEVEHFIEEIDKWIERNLGDDEDGDADPLLLEKIGDKPAPISVTNNWGVPAEGPEKLSGRRGTVVTDLSQLSKGDVVDCYWNDSISDGRVEATGVRLDRDPSMVADMGERGFSGGTYWWDPTRHSHQEVRLVEKAKPERLTDSSLLPTTKGSQITVYEVSTRYGSPRRFIDGVAYEHDGDYSSEWVRQGPAHQGKAEILLDRKRILEFEVTYDAGKENA